MAHISDPHFAARVRASFERQNAMNLIMGYSSVGAVVGTTTNGRRLPTQKSHSSAQKLRPKAAVQ